MCIKLHKEKKDIGITQHTTMNLCIIVVYICSMHSQEKNTCIDIPLNKTTKKKAHKQLVFWGKSFLLTHILKIANSWDYHHILSQINLNLMDVYVPKL